AFLGNSLALGASAFVIGAGALQAPKTQAAGVVTRTGLKFNPVKANSLDTITVPDNFNWQIVAQWGDPLFSDTPEFDHLTRGTAESQALAFGDNNDGMDLFQIDGKNVMVVNNEYTNRSVMFGYNPLGLPETVEDVNKGKMAHGVTIMEVANTNGQWGIVKDSRFNRRFTPDTPIDIVGPARGSLLLKTKNDPDGETVLGTYNNCGNGRTPWGTYLACEENFNGYFSNSQGDDRPLTKEQKRYGIKNTDWGYGWAKADDRFDLSVTPNEPNRHGWITEINPATGEAKKLTALGRFKHENAEVVIASDGRVVVYMGDDERGDYLYKFVSSEKYVEGGDNHELLHKGELFVAKFSDDGTGTWINLKKANMGTAETLVFARLAADKLGATTMDRPEWVAANPHKTEAYVCLTNNKNRGKEGKNQPVNAVNHRVNNQYGQIARWIPTDGNHSSDTFDWDLFVVAGNPAVHTGDNAGSGNITQENMFNSPDGLKFDKFGNLWIQTDGKYSDDGDFAGMGNNQMLLGNTLTGEISRFLVGPKECEVTGLTWSVDHKTMFVGIQHPGEKGDSLFPGGVGTIPRSAIVAIQRNDGEIIG
ncbi:MAG: PhoX family phosphatase, partial [Pseudomonadota bacterium]|nr:PhoX family phosphatase [Pseudomonadota bacterium]